MKMKPPVSAFLPTPDVAPDCCTMTERKKTWTKVVQAAPGFVQARYPGISKIPIPKHPLINDVNQDFCNGWTRFGDVLPHPQGDLVCEQGHLAHRVFHGLKPAAEMFGPAWAIDQWESTFASTDRFTTRRGKPRRNGTGAYDFEVAAKGTPDEVFGPEYLDAVASYYRTCLPSWDVVHARLSAWRSQPLSSLFDRADWASADICDKPIVGLTLGYPIENTVAGMRAAVR